MIRLEDHLFRPGAVWRDSLRTGNDSRPLTSSLRSCEVDRASSEVIRARDATHKPIAESRAATGGRSESRTRCEEVHAMKASVWRESIEVDAHDTGIEILVEGFGPRRRCTSKRSSIQKEVTSLNASSRVAPGVPIEVGE